MKGRHYSMKTFIAVCDDEKKVAGELEMNVEKILTKLGHKHEIDVFLSSEELMEAIETKQCFDLIFLDVHFAKDKLDGVDVGTAIRKTYDSNDVAIVFISREQSYAMRLFELQPQDFLMKPLEFAKIDRVIRRYLDSRGKRFSHIEYSYSKDIYKVWAKDVAYVESVGRKIILHINNGEERCFNGTLKTFHEEQLKRLDFLQISESISVNHDYIVDYTYKDVKLRNIDELFSVSQPRRKNVKEAYLEIETRKGL